HPDKAGGLGFLSISAYAFAPVFVAHSIVWAGMIGNRIWHESASLLGFKQEIAGLVVVLLTLLFVPLMAFSLRLMEAKRIGLGDYGDLSQKYVRRFNEKWIRGEAPAAESLVGSPDIQSLADMANSFNIVTGMQPVPFGKETVLRMAILLVLPFLPLTLTIIPVDKILDKLVGVLL
ncbi:MAG TPA: hypothetical protein VFX30_10045, partial [bacterium]|nr:hypothetical protein [bacterium]